MTAALLLGVAVGVGIMLIGTGLRPAREPLADALDRLDTTPDRADTGPVSLWVRIAGRPAARTAVGHAMVAPIRQQLRIIGRTPEEHLARTAVYVTVAALWAPVTAVLMAAGGVQVGWVLPMWTSLVLAAVALVVPQFAVRSDAAERRRSFRHAFGCFLDLVAVRLAGGAGVDSALAGSANAGDGWAFREIRQALTDARLRGEPSWNGLARLGADIGVTELEELAASAGLAGDEGARVRVSIAAKARAIRVRGLADAEAAAQSASERMSLPVVALMAGFIVFLGYPAIAQVINGL